jgi:hypothetical protein
MAKPRPRTQKQYYQAILRRLEDALGGEGWDDPRVTTALERWVPPTDPDQRTSIAEVIEQMLNDSYDPRDHLEEPPYEATGPVTVLVTFIDLRSRNKFHRVEMKFATETWYEFEKRMRLFGFDFPFKLYEIWNTMSVKAAREEIRKHPETWD